MVLPSAKCPRPDGKTPYERRFGEPFEGQWLNIIRRHRKISRFGKRVLPGISLGYEPIAGRIWKGDILMADLEDLEKLDASDFYPQRKGSINQSKRW